MEIGDIITNKKDEYQVQELTIKQNTIIITAKKIEVEQTSEIGFQVRKKSV